MLELTPANAAEYLRRKGWVGPGPVEVEALSGGVSNAVLRVAHSERVFILKQSRPQLRTRDAWFSDLDRVYREQEVMQVLQPLCRRIPSRKSSSATAPNMSSPCRAPDDARPWKESLLAGSIDFRPRPGKPARFSAECTTPPHTNPRLIDGFQRSRRLRATPRRSLLSPHPGTPARSRIGRRRPH